MPKIYVTDRKGNEYPVEATKGFTLMEAIRDENKFELAAICGGMMSCSTCHVYIDPTWLPKMPKQDPDEQQLLEDLAHRQDNSRLSCQIDITDEMEGLKVVVAPED